MPADSRAPHHMPVHSNYPPPGPVYAQQPGHPMHHHHPSRQMSTGPPPPMPVGGPHVNGPPMPMGGPPPEAVAQTPVSNGRSHGTPAPPGMSQAARAGKEQQDNMLQQLATANENTWMLIGAVSEQMQDQNRALEAFENALRHNPNSILGLNAVASIWRSRDNFEKAIEYFQRILNISQDKGDVWGSMGHCLLMKDDLPKAYTAYQQALHYLPNPKEPKLWYGIGILYDRYGSFEHAEEAFSSVLKMDPNFEKANEIYFRLGIIYKHQRKYSNSLQCFRYIIDNPPRPLTSWDIYFQLGHVYELDHDYESAREAYMRVLSHQPDHAKVLQQLGWLYTQPAAAFVNQEQAVAYLTKSLETDGSDAQSWYLLGRAFMAGQRYNKAYEAYQQAVYRDGRNPTFWCSIGVLYFQINQYRDALDAYSRAIRINPYISEVWYNLGSLYESCNNQITDAIDAYSRAADLDPQNTTIKHRLQSLQNGGNQQLPPPPPPVDVHPSQYNSPPGNGGYNGSPGGSPRMGHPQPPPGGPGEDRPMAQPGARDLPAPPPDFAGGRPHSPGPFRGGAAPPPLTHVDETRGNLSRQPPLAPIDTDRRDIQYRDGPPGPSPRGPPGPGFGQGPVPGRYDLAIEVPHGASPSSPRRRHIEPGPPQGYPGYPPPGPSPREREEWARRDPRGMPPFDPRQPSPRPNERGPLGPKPIDPRDYPQRRFDGFPPDGPRDRPGFPEEQYPEEFKPPVWNDRNGRPPSVAREMPPDIRAPSPAQSTSSKASARRKKDDDKRKPAKQASAPKGRRLNGEDPSPRPSPAPSHASSSHRPPPARSIDEDYDEGAADALMFLHADRRAPTTSLQADKSPPNSLAGTKRASPPSPELSRPTGDSKKSRGSPGGSPTKRTTVIEVLNVPNPAPRKIEVLNAPRIGDLKNHGGKSPLPRSPDTAVSASKPTSPESPEPRPENHSAERGGKASPPLPLSAIAPMSDTRTSPVTARSPIAARSPEAMMKSPERSNERERTRERTQPSPASPKTVSRDKPPSAAEDVEMADGDKDKEE